MISVELEKKAADLVNPASGIANDFLNHFNEALLLIENLPVLLPEMVEELMQWRPRTYVEYFRASNLPGGAAALKVYEGIPAELRASFEERVDQANDLCCECVGVIRGHRKPDGTIEVEDVEDYCSEASRKLRSVLDDLAGIVNTGRVCVTNGAQG